VAYSYVADGGKTETGFTAIYASIRSPILQKVSELAAAGGYTALYGIVKSQLALPRSVSAQPA
jgi:hypothetical protein